MIYLQSALATSYRNEGTRINAAKKKLKTLKETIFTYIDWIIVAHITFDCIYQN